MELQTALEYADAKLKRYVNFIHIPDCESVRGRDFKYYTFADGKIEPKAVELLQQRRAVFADVHYTAKGPVLMDSGKQLLSF